jgi:NAD(P)-dependent dehydrogenase (short-subunit alcohol dehydrogenase family)
LSGKAAVVTGASKGIGAGIAEGLAAEGAAVVVTYASSKEGAEKVLAEIKAKGGKARAVHGDVAAEFFRRGGMCGSHGGVRGSLRYGAQNGSSRMVTEIPQYLSNFSILS